MEIDIQEQQLTIIKSTKKAIKCIKEFGLCASLCGVWRISKITKNLIFNYEVA